MAVLVAQSELDAMRHKLSAIMAALVAQQAEQEHTQRAQLAQKQKDASGGVISVNKLRGLRNTYTSTKPQGFIIRPPLLTTNKVFISWD